MKKRMTGLLLALVLAFSLTGTTFAADSTATNANGDVVKGIDGSTVRFVEVEDGAKIEVTFTSDKLEEGKQYIILMVAGEADPEDLKVPEINESSILYIDQQAVATNGSITFEVYPSSLRTGVILISSAETGQKIAAIVEAKFLLGDLNGDGDVTAKDVTKLLRIVAKIDPLEPGQTADFNKDGDVTAKDVTRLLRAVAKIEPL